MAISRPERWIVISGAIRHAIEFNANISKALELRREGLVDEIILSTWYDEIDRTSGLRKLLLNYGVHTVESEDPPIGGPANIWRQFKSFDVGLRYCPLDSMVLKARTDKSYMYFDFWKTFIEKNREYYSRPQTESLTVLPGRILVPYVSLSALFFCKDIFFYGQRNTLQELIHYEYWSNCAKNEIDWAELRWFSFPFLKKWSVLRDVLETVSYKNLSTAICGRLNSHPAPPKVITKLVGAYWRLLSENFIPISSSAPKQSAAVADLLSAHQFGGVAQAPGGSFSTCTAEWVFDSLNEHFDQSRDLDRAVCASYRDESLLKNWNYLSTEEKRQLNEFVGYPEANLRNSAEYSKANSRIDVEEMVALRSLTTETAAGPEILEAEFEITHQLLRKDRSSPYVESKLIIHWLSENDCARASYWFDKISAKQAVIETDEYIEAFVKFVRCFWLKEKLPINFTNISYNDADWAKHTVQKIVEPQEFTRVENMISFSRMLKKHEAILLPAIYRAMTIAITLLVEEALETPA